MVASYATRGDGQLTNPVRKYGKDGAHHRITPQSIESEESLLGAVFLSKDVIASVVEICQSSDFYKPSHQRIFDAITSIKKRRTRRFGYGC